LLKKACWNFLAFIVAAATLKKTRTADTSGALIFFYVYADEKEKFFTCAGKWLLHWLTEFFFL